jgi:hypothetical protein
MEIGMSRLFEQRKQARVAQRPVVAKTTAAPEAEYTAVLSKHGWHPSQADNSVFVHPNHKGHEIELNKDQWSHIRRVGPGRSLELSKGRSHTSMDKHLKGIQVGETSPASQLNISAAAQAPASAAAPAAPRTPAAPRSAGRYAYWSAEALSAVIAALTKIDNFENAKAEQQAVAEMAEELNSRPKQAEEEGATKQANMTGVSSGFISDENTAKILEGDKSIPNSRGSVDDNTGITRPKTDSVSKFASRQNYLQMAKDAIERGEDVCYDVASEAGQIFGNVKHMSWFEKAVADEIESLGDQYQPEKDLSGEFEPDSEGDIYDEESMNHFASDESTSKTAAEMTLPKAIKLTEDLEDKLQKLYLDAKPLTSINNTRPVRDAVEAIYQAMTLFDPAAKALAKQERQETEEELAQAAAIPKTKKSSFGGLIIARAEVKTASSTLKDDIVHGIAQTYTTSPEKVMADIESLPYAMHHLDEFCNEMGTAGY